MAAAAVAGIPTAGPPPARPRRSAARPSSSASLPTITTTGPSSAPSTRPSSFDQPTQSSSSRPASALRSTSSSLRRTKAGVIVGSPSPAPTSALPVPPARRKSSIKTSEIPFLLTPTSTGPTQGGTTVPGQSKSREPTLTQNGQSETDGKQASQEEQGKEDKELDVNSNDRVSSSSLPSFPSTAPTETRRGSTSSRRGSGYRVPVPDERRPSAKELAIMLQGIDSTESTFVSAPSYYPTTQSSLSSIQPLRLSQRRGQPKSNTSLHSSYEESNNAREGGIEEGKRSRVVSAGTAGSSPSTPGFSHHSVYSDATSEEDSLATASTRHLSWASSHHKSKTPLSAVARRLDYEDEDEAVHHHHVIRETGKTPAEKVLELLPAELVNEKPTAGNTQDEAADIDSMVPAPVCPLIAEPDIPGVIPVRRTDSASSSSSSSSEEDDEDADSIYNFGIDSFPVPSTVLAVPTPTLRRRSTLASFAVLATPTATPKASPTEEVGAESGVKVKTTTTVLSTRPRPDLFEESDLTAVDWDMNEELEIRDRVFRAEMKAPSKEDKQRRRRLRQEFSQTALPTKKDLYEASLLSVRDEYGNRIRFGSLFEGQRTIVCFIRHFWCSLCQDYVDSISKIKPSILEKHNLRLIIVSNGSYKMIRSYKKVLGEACPYPIYTDRGKHVYTALGMTLRTFSMGKSEDKGKYIKRTMTGNIVQGIVNGIVMPKKPPGDQQQLGGEFVLGPGLNVKFCHRMPSTRGHAEIEAVLSSVGVDLNGELEMLAPTPMMSSSGFSPNPSSPSLRPSSGGIESSTGSKKGLVSSGLMSRIKSRDSVKSNKSSRSRLGGRDSPALPPLPLNIHSKHHLSVDSHAQYPRPASDGGLYLSTPRLGTPLTTSLSHTAFTSPSPSQDDEGDYMPGSSTSQPMVSQFSNSSGESASVSRSKSMKLGLKSIFGSHLQPGASVASSTRSASPVTHSRQGSPAMPSASMPASFTPDSTGGIGNTPSSPAASKTPSAKLTKVKKSTSPVSAHPNRFATIIAEPSEANYTFAGRPSSSATSVASEA